MSFLSFPKLWCCLLVVALLAGCFAPAPERVTLEVPADASAAVSVTVTLYELPADRRSVEEAYAIAPGETVTVAGLDDGVAYRLELVVDGELVWADTLASNEFLVLELLPDGTVRDVGGGTYGTATEASLPAVHTGR